MSTITVEKWSSKFARTKEVGILFAKGEKEIWPEMEGGAWKVGNIRIPKDVVTRKRSAHGLDFAPCCAADWGKAVPDPLTGKPSLKVRCSARVHEPIFIPCDMILKVILPPDSAE